MHQQFEAVIQNKVTVVCQSNTVYLMCLQNRRCVELIVKGARRLKPNEQGVVEESTMQAYTEALHYDGIVINRMFLVINRKALEGLGDCAKGAMHELTRDPFDNEVEILQGITTVCQRKRNHANEAKDSKDDKDDVKYNVVNVVKL